MNDYAKHRKQVESRFHWYRKLRDKTERHQSPCGNYELKVEYYKTGKNSWNYSKGTVKAKNSPIVIAEIKRNYSHFWFQWVSHANGNDYLLCGEDYQGYTTVNLTKTKVHHHFPQAGFDGWGFCWTAAYPSPDCSVLAVDGCIWAAPYEIVFYDFSKPDKLPYRELKRVGPLETPHGWDNEVFRLDVEVEIRKSDGAPYDELSEQEQDDLDNTPGSLDSISKTVSVSLDELKV